MKNLAFFLSEQKKQFGNFLNKLEKLQ